MRWAARTYKLEGSCGIVRELLPASSGPSSWSPHLLWAAVSDPLVTASEKENPRYSMFYFGLSLYIAANILALVIAVKASS